MEIKTYKPIKKVTNGGDLAKYRIKFVNDGNQNAIIINKLTLSSELNYGRFSLPLKVFKGKVLFFQQLAFTVDTYKEINNILKDVL